MAPERYFYIIDKDTNQGHTIDGIKPVSRFQSAVQKLVHPDWREVTE
jgi:hypothetical protein